jgi:hypothetical protein
MSSPVVRSATVPDPVCNDIVAMPNCLNLTIYEGDDVYLDVHVLDSGGGAVDLTGSTATAQIRADTDSGDILANFQCYLDGTDLGLIHLHLPSSENVAMPETGVWDVQFELDTNITTLLYGTVNIHPEVTRPEFAP